MSVPVTPVIPKDFSPEWAEFVLKDWFIKNERDVDKIKISRVEALLNGEQGLLSTTFIVDVFFQEEEGDEEKKSIFVKIPLIGEASKNFKQVNVREYEMFTNVLPELQKYLEETCDGFFCMGVPEVIYCYYSGDEVHDALIIENLVETGFLTCTTKDLHVDNNGKDYLKSTLETLSQLHGTGLHFKKSLDGNKGVLDRFPKIEEQIQIKDILKNKESRTFLRQHFCAFIRYLEETDPELKNITAYMKKMETYLFKILKVLEDSGVRHLNTLCHGDAKPNNFMFRKIDIDFGDADDEELQDLKCEGVESMLIDWQGGFLGSLCNDLMWCMFPFFEVNSHDKELYEFAFHHYYDELKNVLHSFNADLKDFGFPGDFAEFRSLVRRGFVLEFLIVTVLRPVMNITNPEEIMKWYKKLEKYDRMKAKGGVYAFWAGKKPKLPPQESVFQNPRYMEFLQFYFKIATALGAFQELGLIYFELMKDGLFKDTTKPMPQKPKAFTKPWFKNMMSCVKGEPESEDEEEDELFKEKKEEITVQEEIPAVTTEEEEVEIKENLYEPIAEPEIIEEVVVIREEREPSPPDPLRALAAQLQQQFVGYKATFNEFSNVMDNYKPEPLAEEESAEIQASISRAKEAARHERKLSTDEEIALVKTMSNENAWSHVVSEVMKEKKQAEREVITESKNIADYSKFDIKVSKVEEKTTVQKMMTESVVTDITMESKEISATKEMNDGKPRPESKENADKNAAVQSNSGEMMKRISMDIDISNQKVLETIEFLSSTSSNQDEETISNITSENDVSNATEICVKNTTSLARKTGMTKNDFVESLVNESLTDAKHIYAYAKKSENEFEKISAENVLKKETLDSSSKNVDDVKTDEPTDTRNSILAWLSLSSQPKTGEEINQTDTPQTDNITIKQEDDIKEQSEQNESDKQLPTSNKCDEEVSTKSSILTWLNLGKPNTSEDGDKGKEPEKEIRSKPQLERTFSNDLDECKTEVENIQNNIISFVKDTSSENSLADLKDKILKDEITPIKPPRTSISDKSLEIVDALESPKTVREVDDKFKIVKSKRESTSLTNIAPKESITVAENNTQEVSITKSDKQVKTEKISASSPNHKDTMAAEERLALAPPSWAQVAEKQNSNVEPELVLAPPEEVITLKSSRASTVVVSVDEKKNTPNEKKEDGEGFTIVKSKKESQIYQGEIENNKSVKQEQSKTVKDEILEKTEDIKEYYQKVENYLATPGLKQTESKQIDVSDIQPARQAETGEQKGNAIAEESEKGETQEKNELVADNEEQQECMTEGRKEETKTEAPEVHQKILCLEAPTWASIAEKPKQNAVDEIVLTVASDIITLPPHKFSTVVVALDDDVENKKKDDDGFTIVRSKRESQVCMESEEKQSNKQLEVEKSKTVDIEAEYKQVDLLNGKIEKNININGIEDNQAEALDLNNKTISAGDEKINEKTEIRAMKPIEQDPPILSISAPSWASIAEKPKLSNDDEPALTIPTDVITLPPHKLSTVVVAVDDEVVNSVNKDKDDEGFTVVKPKRETQTCLETEKIQSKKQVEEETERTLTEETIDVEKSSTVDVNQVTDPLTKEDETEIKTTKHSESDQPILSLTAPTWASIAEKPKPSIEDEPLLTQASDVITLPPHKLSTVVIAVEDEEYQINKDIDEDGFTVVKSKKEGNNYIQANGEEILEDKDDIVRDSLTDSDITHDDEKADMPQGEDKGNALVMEINEFIESENQATEQTEGEGENTLGNEIKDCTYNIETLSRLLDGILIDKAILTTESNANEVIKGEMEKRHIEKEETCVEKEETCEAKEETREEDEETSVENEKTYEAKDETYEEKEVTYKENEEICEEKQETCEENRNIHIEKKETHVEKEDMHVEKEKIQTGKDKTYLEITESEKPILSLEATTSIAKKTKPSLESEPELTQTENQSNQVNLKDYEINLVKEFNSFMETEEKEEIKEKGKENENIIVSEDMAPNYLTGNKVENALVSEIKKFMETEENVSDHLVANKDEHHITTESNSLITTEKKHSNKEDNYLVTEINHFMETEEKHLKQLIVNKDKNALVTEMKHLLETEERPTVVGNSKPKNISATNGIEKESRNVLDSLEGILSRKSESRMSVKKRKQKNSIKSLDQLPDLIDSEEKSNPELKRKSEEVFDFYVNSIDGDTATSESQVSPENISKNKIENTENGKSDEQIVIENVLNSIPSDLTRCDRLGENSTEKENGDGIKENGNTETDIERLEETGNSNFGSTCTSGANTLRRSWKRQNSKKKRKSQHVL